MSEDIFPSNNAKFDAVQKQLLAAVAASPDKYGVTPAAVAATQAKQGAWTLAFPAATSAAAAYHTATKAADTARLDLETELRAIAKTAHAHPGITPGLLAAAALRPHDEVRTHIGAPVTRPIARIAGKPLTHEVHWVDETTPHKRAKPAHVRACELYLKIGDPAPPDPSACLYAATKTRSPETYVFGPADEGKTAYWYLRWVSPNDERGPWSAQVSAKIAGL